MTVFNPFALSADLQDLADARPDSNAAPAVLLAIADADRQVRISNGSNDLQGTDAARFSQSYEIGSQTKSIAALVTLQLVEEGLLDLDRPVTAYLPSEMTDGIANIETATLGQLLSMRSGIPNYTAIEDEDGDSVYDLIIADNLDRITGVPEALDLIRGMSATATPGSTYQYSNTNFVLIGNAIEAVTGKPLHQVFAERVFVPLGMQNSFLNQHNHQDDRLRSYAINDDGLFEVTEAPLDMQAAGGVISTTADMITFYRALLVDRTLAPDWALAVMTNWGGTGLGPAAPLQEPSEDQPVIVAYGNGLLITRIFGLGDFIGFNGGTLGTETISLVHQQTGRIITYADNLVDAQGAPMWLEAFLKGFSNPDWQAKDDGSAIEVTGLSAAALGLDFAPDEIVFHHQGVSQRFDRSIEDLRAGGVTFEDGSALHLGTDGSDRILLYSETDDQIRGFGGHDRLSGGAGDDLILGGAGRDRLRGQAGDDHLLGEGGRDRLSGGQGADLLEGGQGRDDLRGGAGADTLIGGAGHDRMRGGDGADLFVFAESAGNGRFERDRILDFTLGADRLDLGEAGIAAARLSDHGLHLRLDTEDRDLILLSGSGFNALTDLDQLF